MESQSPQSEEQTYKSAKWLCYTLEQVYEKIQEEFDKGCAEFQIKHDEFEEGHNFELWFMK